MNFLKKHYEKIILAFFLLIFIFSLAWTIIVLKKSHDVSLDDCRLPRIPANFPRTDMNIFEIPANFAKDKDWVSAHSGSADETKSYMDLMIPYPAARCPLCTKIIPYSAFYAELCPVCNGKLSKPGAVIVDGGDMDRDGISNVDEKKLGLDPNNPDDVFLDMDNDGFNNKCEYVKKTDLNNPKSHPDMSLRLFVKEISRKPLPLKLKKVLHSGEDKSKWEIHAEARISAKGKYQLKFFRIGDTIELNKEKYKIIDIVPKTVNKIDPKLKTEVTEDVSEVIIQNDTNDPIIVRPNAVVYENKDKITIGDITTGKEYITTNGGTFSVIIVGDETCNYNVVKSGDKDGLLTLKESKTGQETVIGKESRMSEFMKVESAPALEKAPEKFEEVP